MSQPTSTGLTQAQVVSMMDAGAHKTGEIYAEFFRFYPNMAMSELGLTDQFAVGIAQYLKTQFGINWGSLVTFNRIQGAKETELGADMVIEVQLTGHTGKTNLFVQAKVGNYDPQHPNDIRYAYADFTYRSKDVFNEQKQINTLGLATNGQCYQLSQNNGYYIVYMAGATRWVNAGSIVALSNKPLIQGQSKKFNELLNGDFNREAFKYLAKVSFGDVI